MNGRSKYRTKQREILLAYFERLPGVHVTAGDVCDYLREQGAGIGQSTVYRQLENLVEEGIIKKYVIDMNSPACFEYVVTDIQKEAETCFHCKCEKCGKLIHLRCDEMEGMLTHLQEEHGFRVNPVRTVFYGLCENCL